jgi:hypothetical protein
VTGIRSNCSIVGISRPKVPCAGALLCDLGSRLELLRAVHSALVSVVLSLDQVPGRMLLKQLSCLKTDGACEGWSLNLSIMTVPLALSADADFGSLARPSTV